MTRLRIKDKREPRLARDMLAAQVRYGQGQAHAWEKYDLSNEEGVKKLLADAGHTDYKRLVEEVRPKDAPLPLATYLFQTGLSVNLPPGESFVAIRYGDGEELARIQGESGRLVMTQYLERFRHSVRNLERCTSGEEADYGDLLSCFADGLASIEGFVNQVAQPHLDRLPRGRDELVGLDFKLDEWIPLLSGGGQRVDKSRLWWLHFKEVRSIRNWRQSHPRASVYGIGDSTFCNQLNLWRNGIALMLLYLHALTGRLATPELVRWAHVPDIELVRD